jgi:peptidoglycan/xylan/chitin deacetylase (PgdA/CDA1 family)
MTDVWFKLHTLAWRKRGRALSPQSATVSLTFDGNWQNLHDYAFPLLRSRGIVGTFYVVTDLIRDFSLNSANMSFAELRDLQNYGHEIASHSKTHPHFTRISDDQIHRECSESKQVLQSHGFQVNNFAYPFGDTNDHVDSIVRNYYRSGRTAYAPPYIMQLPTTQFRLTGACGETDTGVKVACMRTFLMRYKRLRVVDRVCHPKDWMILFFHDVVTNPSRPRQISTQDFADLLDYLILRHMKIVTVNQALDDQDATS